MLTKKERKIEIYSSNKTPTVPHIVTPNTPLETLNLNWSERDLPEKERTKHVHRLHPYLGKSMLMLLKCWESANPDQSAVCFQTLGIVTMMMWLLEDLDKLPVETVLLKNSAHLLCWNWPSLSIHVAGIGGEDLENEIPHTRTGEDYFVSRAFPHQEEGRD